MDATSLRTTGQYYFKKTVPSFRAGLQRSPVGRKESEPSVRATHIAPRRSLLWCQWANGRIRMSWDEPHMNNFIRITYRITVYYHIINDTNEQNSYQSCVGKGPLARVWGTSDLVPGDLIELVTVPRWVTFIFQSGFSGGLIMFDQLWGKEQHRSNARREGVVEGQCRRLCCAKTHTHTYIYIIYIHTIYLCYGQVTSGMLLTSCARWHQTLCPATAWWSVVRQDIFCCIRLVADWKWLLFLALIGDVCPNLCIKNPTITSETAKTWSWSQHITTFQVKKCQPLQPPKSWGGGQRGKSHRWVRTANEGCPFHGGAPHGTAKLSWPTDVQWIPSVSLPEMTVEAEVGHFQECLLYTFCSKGKCQHYDGDGVECQCLQASTCVVSDLRTRTERWICRAEIESIACSQVGRIRLAPLHTSTLTMCQARALCAPQRAPIRRRSGEPRVTSMLNQTLLDTQHATMPPWQTARPTCFWSGARWVISGPSEFKSLHLYLYEWKVLELFPKLKPLNITAPWTCQQVEATRPASDVGCSNKGLTSVIVYIYMIYIMCY